MVYTDDQIKSYAMQLQQKGASPQEIDTFVSSAKGVAPAPSAPATPGGYQPGMLAKGVGAIGGFLKDAGSAIINGTADDFKALSDLPRAAIDPAHKNIWTDIGGSISALTDVGIVGAGILTGETTTPAALAAKEAAGAGIKEVVGAGAKMLGKKAVTTTGGLAVGAGLSEAAKAKGKGATGAEALSEGVATGAETALTFGLLNKFGPKVSNMFLDTVGKTKFAEGIQTSLKQTVDYLKMASESAKLGETATNVKNTVNAAASKVVTAVFSMLKGTASSIVEPSSKEVGFLADNAYSNVNRSSAIIDSKYGALKSDLAKYEVPKTVVDDINAIVSPSAAKPSADELQKMYQAEEDKILSASMKAGMSAEEISAQAKRTVDASLRGVATETGTAITEEAQRLAAMVKSGGKVTLQDAFDILNKVPDEVQAAQVKDKIYSAIKETLSKTPEGTALWDKLRELSTNRSENQAQRAFAEELQNLKGRGWVAATDKLFSMLKTAGDVQNLKQALGGSLDMFKKMLSKAMTSETAIAYKNVIDRAGGVITPELSTEAQKAATAVMDKYLAKMNELPGLFTPEEQHFFIGMRHSISDLTTVAEHSGIDLPRLASGEISKEVQATKETLDVIKGSPAWKAITSASPSETPRALLNSSVEELSALKQTLGADSEEWKALGASVISHVLKTVQGLWGETDKATIEKTLEKLSTAVSGSEEKFGALLDTVDSSGKTIKGSQILQDLVNYGKEAKKGMDKNQKGILAATGALLAHSLGHPFMAINEGRKAIGMLTAEDVSMIEKYTKQSMPALRAEITSAAKKGEAFPSEMARTISRIQSVVMTLIKYETAKSVSGAMSGSGNQ